MCKIKTTRKIFIPVIKLTIKCLYSPFMYKISNFLQKYKNKKVCT